MKTVLFLFSFCLLSISQSFNKTEDFNLEGKWVNLKGCSTSSEKQTYFMFNGDGTDHIFNADCRNSCENHGYFLYFNYTSDESSFTLNYTSVSEYCGAKVPAPKKPATIEYIQDSNTITFGKVTWTKI